MQKYFDIQCVPCQKGIFPMSTAIVGNQTSIVRKYITHKDKTGPQNIIFLKGTLLKYNAHEKLLTISKN